MLILRRANAGRPGGPWDEDDYDVLAGERVIGRIVRTPSGGLATPWSWTILVRLPNDPTDRGYAATREDAMAELKASWLRPR